MSAVFRHARQGVLEGQAESKTMRIRTKILLSHLVLLLTVTLASLAIVAALLLSKNDRRQLQTSYEQLRNIKLVAVDANRFSEQIAELFILGGEEADIAEARDTLIARLEQRRRLIQAEDALSNHGSARPGRLESVDGIERIVARMDRAQSSLHTYLIEGRKADAERMWRRDFEGQLEQSLEALIDDAMAHDRQEVQAALASSARLSRQSMLFAIGLVAIVATLGLGNVFMLNRTILRPVARLAAGADAVGRGDLDHVVGTGARDELGNLASRFNQMTRQMKTQRDFLLHARAELSEKVAERTQELQERTRQLETLNARLRAVDDSRAQFFADVSHELRTPLTILRGEAEVALRDPHAGTVVLKESLQSVVRKAVQIGRLVDDLLFLARSEAGTIGIERGPVVLQEVIADVLLDGQGLSRREGVRILPHQSAEPIRVRGDGDRLRQAVLIALDNAIKHAPPGTSVSLDLRREEERAVVRVRDRGPGFTEEDLASAFSRFYRGASSRTKGGRGLGLGLSIAKWIVDEHDGTIRIDSVPDGGAAVEISIPLAEEDAAAEVII